MGHLVEGPVNTGNLIHIGDYQRPVLAIDLLSCSFALAVSVVFVDVPLPEMADAAWREKNRQKGGSGAAIRLTRHIDVSRQPASVRADGL
jgi:hypothetical protein